MSLKFYDHSLGHVVVTTLAHHVWLKTMIRARVVLRDQEMDLIVYLEKFHDATVLAVIVNYLDTME